MMPLYYPSIYIKEDMVSYKLIWKPEKKKNVSRNRKEQTNNKRDNRRRQDRENVNFYITNEFVIKGIDTKPFLVY